MRPRHSLPVALLFFLSAFLLLTAAARADDTNSADDEYEEHARVLRVSLLKGEVTLRRAGSDEWERAQLNTPLVEGDTLSTGRDSRLEIQADVRNFVRVGESSVLKVVTLRDEGIALSLSEGTATIKLSRLDRGKEYFELDAPKTTVAAERAGQYRVDCNADRVRVTVREGGRARIYSETSGFELGSERTARLALAGEGDDWDLGAAEAQFDEWDTWNAERERYVASRLNSEGRERYYDSDVYGAEELDAYGEWSYTNDYGYVWRPSASYISGYDDWAPYRYGHWDWCPPYGWTWVADEPWGWAPYHYGRWVNVNNNWCWAPRGYGYRYRRAWWRPALVAFVTVDFGSERRVCWYPLTYGQRDPRGRFWSRRFEPTSPTRRGGFDKRHPMSPAILRAVTSAPINRFGDRNFRARAAGDDIARRAIEADPVHGRLPVEHSDPARGFGGHGRGGDGRFGRGVETTDENGRRVLTINRPAPVMPSRAIPERPTGAAPRSPGLPLDGQLRRTHVFGDRRPRALPPSDTSGGARNGVDNTGAVARPDTTRRTPRYSNPTEPDANGETRERRREPSGRFDSSTPQRTTPTQTPERPRRNVDAPHNDNPTPAPIYRPQPRTYTPENDDARPRSKPPRQESRPDNPAPRESPRYEQPPRAEPPHRESPRQETPRREEPRQEAPRQSAPRQETPRQESPRPESPHHDSPRQESPHQEPPASSPAHDSERARDKSNR